MTNQHFPLGILPVAILLVEDTHARALIQPVGGGGVGGVLPTGIEPIISGTEKTYVPIRGINLCEYKTFKLY